jgi:U3 small nucleolar RNA-associated protein 11
MPVDMVKILKTQDENYVRTIRSSNAKVGYFCVRRERWNLKRAFSQKIDRIKAQLSTMADLVREGGDVDEEDLPVLEKSGVFVGRKSKGKAKARSVNGPGHIVFVEEGEEGPSCLILCRMQVGSLSRL